MARIHIILNAKGGIGKSFIASLLIQYFQDQKANVLGIDTDPNNSTIVNTKALNAKFLELLNEDGVLQRVGFDKIIDEIDKVKPDECIIDSGATTFNDFSQYLKENACIELFESMGLEVLIHVPITAGQEQLDTLEGLINIVNSFNCKIIVWKNEKNGSLENVEDTSEIKSIADKISAYVLIKERSKDTFGEDLKNLTSKHLTFNEALNSSDFTIMSKQRRGGGYIF